MIKREQNEVRNEIMCRTKSMQVRRSMLQAVKWQTRADILASRSGVSFETRPSLKHLT